MIQKLKANAGSIMICLLEILVGILLLINPIGFTSAIIIMAGIALMLFGCACGIRYFRTEANAAAQDMTLVQGLIGVTAGLFCVLRSDWFAITFPMLTILYGIAALVTGFYKVQLTVNMLRREKGDWGWVAVSAVLSLALAAVILLNPFSSSAFLWDFTAISLIVVAVYDIVILIMFMYRGKNRHGFAKTENGHKSAAHSRG